LTLKNTHYISGVIITLFITLHLFNHSISVFGIDQHIEVMRTLRFFYRNLIAESILLIAVITQIVSGLKLFIVKRRIATTRFEKLQIWTGLYLAIFFIIHLSAVFGGRYVLRLDTNFYFGVAGLNTFPYNIFFIPYYGLAILSFFGHLAAIHSKKMKQTIFGFSVLKQSIAILIGGFIFTMVIFYGLTNKFNGVNLPKEYKILIGK
jgi:hypothetical protein